MEARGSRAPRSILESLGEEVTAIVTPVSMCMALTVVLVKILNPTGASSQRAVSIASIYYSEQVCAVPESISSHSNKPAVEGYWSSHCLTWATIVCV